MLEILIITWDTLTNLWSPKWVLSPNPNLKASTNRCASNRASGAGSIPSNILRINANMMPELGGGPTCIVCPLVKFTGKDSLTLTLKTEYLSL